MAKPKVTLKDIAVRTGYAVNTVSLALRGSTRISGAVRELIGTTARELGYIPNNVAKSLVSHKSNTIGLILHEITNPLVTSAAKMIQLALAARGYGVLFATSNGSFEEELHAIEMFRSRMVDGILIYPLLQSRLDHLKHLREQHFPVVLLIGLEETGIDAVGIDETLAARKATRHLIDLGHRRVGAIVNTPAPLPGQRPFSVEDLAENQKFAGYVSALEEAGITVDPALVASPGQHSIAAGIEGMATLMTRTNPPTAVFCSSDLIALGALRWAKQHGVAVPGKVAIIGFDNIEAAAHAVTPLSSIDNDVNQLARLSVEMILRLIEFEGPLPEPATELLDGRLMVRESTVASPIPSAPAITRRRRKAPLAELAADRLPTPEA